MGNPKAVIVVFAFDELCCFIYLYIFEKIYLFWRGGGAERERKNEQGGEGERILQADTLLIPEPILGFHLLTLRS